MSYSFVKEAQARRRRFGAIRLWIWRQWAAFLAWYDIDAGEMPENPVDHQPSRSGESSCSESRKH